MKGFFREFKIRSQKERIYIALFLVVILSLSILYIIRTNQNYHRIAEQNALSLAQSIEAFLCDNSLNTLEYNPDALTKPAYEQTVSRLACYINNNNRINNTYLYILKNDEIHVLLNFEKTGPEQLRVNQEYIQSESFFKTPFVKQKPVYVKTTPPEETMRMSALFPVIGEQAGHVIAVLGMDYTVKQWFEDVHKHTLHAIVITLLIFLLTCAFYISIKTNKRLLSIRKGLKNSKALFKAVFEQAPIGIALANHDQTHLNTNAMFRKITGRTREELKHTNWMDITHPDDLEADLKLCKQLLNGEINGYSMKKRYIRPNDTIAWVNMVIVPLNIKENAEQTHLCLIEDISNQMETEKALIESERSKRVLLSHLPGMAYRCSYDKNWTMLFVSEGCSSLTGYKPESLLFNREISYNDLIAPEYRKPIWEEWARILPLQESFRYEYEITTASGMRKSVLELGQGVFNADGEVEALEGIVIDITPQKKREARIQYMCDHDSLTGLCNRIFFEKEKERLDTEKYLPLSIIIGNIDGIRLINNILGHDIGDKVIIETAGILLSCCRSNDILARTGGDEFSMLLPNTDSEAAGKLIQEILNKIEAFNNIPGLDYSISMSLGFSVKETMDMPIGQIFKEAEDSMQNRRLLNQKSSHNTILSSIMAAMYIRSHETEQHAERLAQLARQIGEKLNLPQKDMDNLVLLAMLHDIGKVGIDNGILNKPGTLNDEEWKIMKKHSELGYQIAKSSPEMEPVAEYIRTHHERWDGKGYPLGLKGEEIPLLSRILSVTDAYDAMTEDRVYRKAMSKDMAIEEIKKNAGTQFDPLIARLFAENI